MNRYAAPAIRVFVVALLAACEAGFAQPVQAPIDPDPQRIALLWHKLSGTKPNIDNYVLNSNEYTGAQEIDRENVYAALSSQIRSDMDSMQPQDDIYTIRIGSQMSAYDPRAGGFFLPLFSGSSYVPIEHNPHDRRNVAQNILVGTYELHFTNPDEFVFWPMAESDARALMAKAGQQPRVTARFLFRPLAAPSVPYIAASSRRIFGQVSQVELLDNRDQILMTKASDLSEAEARTQATRGRVKPSPDVMAMTWHKIVGGPQYDVEQLLRGYNTSGIGARFTADDQAQLLNSFYESLDPGAPFTMLVAAEFAPYDTTTAAFPLRIDRPIEYKSSFPAVAYADEIERTATANAGKPQRFHKLPSTGTVFSVDYVNIDDVGSLEIDPQGAARLRPDPNRSYQARAQLLVVPVRAETVDSYEGTVAENRLYTRIARARIFDAATGQLMMDKSLSEPTQLSSVPYARGGEGTPDFDGLSPYDVDFRSIKLGMTEVEMRAAAKAHFREVRTSEQFAPGYMKLFADEDNLGVTFCQDERICSLSYTRRWNGNLVDDVFQATVDKYGEPASGRKPYDPDQRGVSKEAAMRWTRNYGRVGGVEGRISLSGKQTILFMEAVDKTKKRKEKEKPKVELD